MQARLHFQWPRVPVAWVAPDDFPGLPFLSRNCKLSVQLDSNLAIGRCDITKSGFHPLGKDSRKDPLNYLNFLVSSKKKAMTDSYVRCP